MTEDENDRDIIAELGELVSESDEDVVVNDDERLDRMVKEILDPVNVYTEAEGPEGPWPYRTLTVTRKMNTIYVYDVDGAFCYRLTIPEPGSEGDLSEHTDPHQALRDHLNELNEATLEAL